MLPITAMVFIGCKLVTDSTTVPRIHLRMTRLRFSFLIVTLRQRIPTRGWMENILKILSCHGISHKIMTEVEVSTIGPITFGLFLELPAVLSTSLYDNPWEYDRTRMENA